MSIIYEKQKTPKLFSLSRFAKVCPCVRIIHRFGCLWHSILQIIYSLHISQSPYVFCCSLFIQGMYYLGYYHDISMTNLINIRRVMLKHTLCNRKLIKNDSYYIQERKRIESSSHFCYKTLLHDYNMTSSYLFGNICTY
jgi:hypothetical protein